MGLYLAGLKRSRQPLCRVKAARGGGGLRWVEESRGRDEIIVGFISHYKDLSFSSE